MIRGVEFPGSIRRWWEARGRSVVEEFAAEWRDDRVGGLAAEIAFFGILSVFPALLAVAGALGDLDALIGSALAARAQETVVNFLEQVLTSRAQPSIRSVEALFAESKSGLISVATAGALWALSRGLMAAIRALDVAYDLPRQRSWVRTRGKALLLGLGTVVLFVALLAVVVTGPLLGLGRLLGEAVGLSGPLVTLWLWLRYPLAFALLIAWASFIFHFAPNHRSPWGWDLPGALLTGVLWLVSTLGFRIYLEVAGEVNQVLGVLGGGLTLMLWLYLLSLSLLVGAEANAIVGRHAGRTRRARERG